MNMIDKDAVLYMIDINIEPHTHGEWDSGYNVALSEMREKIKQMPTVDVQPVKHEQRIDHERLIGIFGTLCDYMVDNGRCDVFCPYADTKDESDECEAWRTIQNIRREGRGISYEY